MKIHPIRNEQDYKAALARVEALWEAQPGSAEADELDVWATLVDHYEEEHAPILPPDPIEAILFRLEQNGQSRKDLADMLGVGRGRVSEILNRKRSLSTRMVRKLRQHLNISADILIR